MRLASNKNKTGKNMQFFHPKFHEKKMRVRPQEKNSQKNGGKKKSEY